ncbi:hypothetical protein KbCgl_17630 [Corynebacterium glutamicum]|nr:hypothetical protein KbCgl_17630 [Corynebacterium glutamicum]
MTTVTGKLETITGSPSHATGVWIRAKRASPRGDGLILGSMEKADYNPDTGVVSFSAEPVEAVLMVQGIDRSESFEMIIPDKTSATLRECVEAKTVYHPAVVASGVQHIRDVQAQALSAIDKALADALASVAQSVAAEIGTKLDGKADKAAVEQVQALVMGAMGIASTALKKAKES